MIAGLVADLRRPERSRPCVWGKFQIFWDGKKISGPTRKKVHFEEFGSDYRAY